MSDNYEISMANIREHVVEGSKQAFEKIEGSSYEGFMYELKRDDSDLTLKFDIRLKGDLFIFEAYPGIISYTRDRADDLCVYCQQIDKRFGSVNVNNINGNVFFHMEDFISDSPVSKETITLYENEAIEIFDLHYKNLNNIACEKTALTEPVNMNDRTSDSHNLSISSYKESIDECREYLSKDSGHNSICETVSNESYGVIFMSQVLTGEDIYRLDFVFSPEGVFTINAYYSDTNAIYVKKEYKYLVADIINKYNTRQACGSLHVSSKDGSLYCSIHKSLLDGAISKETIENMEELVIGILNRSMKELYRASHGLPAREAAEDVNEVKHIIEHALEIAGKNRPSRLPFRNLDALKGLFDRTNKELAKPWTDEIDASEFMEDMDLEFDEDPYND